MEKIKIINKSNNPLPRYETAFSSGMDLRASIDVPIILKPLERVLVKTGLFIELPEGYEAQIRPRSGLALKFGITVSNDGIATLNNPGTVDADYRGNIGVILINLSDEDFVVNSGDRIAQMIISKYEKVEWEEVPTLSETIRGDGGFNSTGRK